MTIYVWGAIAVVILTLAALIRRYDTKLVLLIAGLAMCCLSMNPMAAFQQFDKSMTNSALIISICSSMGFAACVTMTKCDLHLVSLLTKPLNKLGILLLPCCMIVTGIASVAIGSLAGLCAAIGPTLVGLMIRAGFRPAMAAAVIISSTLPNYWSPGSTDNIYVAKLANIPVMDMVTYVAPTTLILSALSIVFVMIVCLLFKDYRKEGFGSTGVHPGEDIQKKLPDLPEKPNLLMAFAPLLPVVLLFVISLCFPGVKMSVATAMLMGLIYVMIVTRLNPQQLCSKFFDGMGSGYGSILGLIIAAGVFAAGLKSCGLISLFIDYLKNSSDVAKLGASFGPYLLGIITGSGERRRVRLQRIRHAARPRVRHEDRGPRLHRLRLRHARPRLVSARRRRHPDRRHRRRLSARRRQALHPRHALHDRRALLPRLTNALSPSGAPPCGRDLKSEKPRAVLRTGLSFWSFAFLFFSGPSLLRR